jgi:hypothetical protein
MMDKELPFSITQPTGDPSSFLMLSSSVSRLAPSLREDRARTSRIQPALWTTSFLDYSNAA